MKSGLKLSLTLAFAAGIVVPAGSVNAQVCSDVGGGQGRRSSPLETQSHSDVTMAQAVFLMIQLTWAIPETIQPLMSAMLLV